MPDPAPLPPDVQAALAQGHKIEAIKLLREATGMGLAEAKNLVDQHDRATSPHTPRSIHPESRTGLWLVIALVIVAFIAWRWFGDG